MASKVLYKQGTKFTYLSLPERLDNALYFCTDTKELFKGNDLYTDGVRFVQTKDDLPLLTEAADGRLYICGDTGCGYILNEARDAWVCVLHGVDNNTVEITEDGFIRVREVSMESIPGLEEELQRIEKLAAVGISSLPLATNETPGVIKCGDEFSIAEDGTLSLTEVAISKVSGLEEDLKSLKMSLTWENI